MPTQSNNIANSLPANKLEHKILSMLFVMVVVPIGLLVSAVATGNLQVPAMIASVIAQAVGLGMGYSFLSKTAKQATKINDTLVSINNGDFEARVDLLTNDQLGQAAISLNAMCDNTLNLIQSNAERDQIQTSIESLISEMKEIAAGDLTISTDVNQDITSAIAESVNHMTQQLRFIVTQVKSASEQVNSSSSKIREASTAMSKETDANATRIGEASDQLHAMTNSFQNVALLTKHSVEVAVDARQSASKGLKAVSDTVHGMERIRHQVQNTSKRIKRFGESSQEVGEIVQLISDIADRTSILALNASIQANIAGDAGQGFAVVAEEIERLAIRSTDATKQISKLIRGIQNETSEVISDMEESTREVVAGSKLAAQAGETLQEIDHVSNQLVELIQTSSTSALQQADKATKIASSMNDIATTTKQSAEKSRQATISVGRLADMVNELRGSVSKFKVEESDGIRRAFETYTHSQSKMNPTDAAASPTSNDDTPPAPTSTKRRPVARTINKPFSPTGIRPETPSQRIAAATMVQNEPAENQQTDKALVQRLLAANKIQQLPAEQPTPAKPLSKVAQTMSLDTDTAGQVTDLSNPVANIRKPSPTLQVEQTTSPKTMVVGSEPENDMPYDAAAKAIDENLLRQLEEAKKLLNTQPSPQSNAKSN